MSKLSLSVFIMASLSITACGGGGGGGGSSPNPPTTVQKPTPPSDLAAKIEMSGTYVPTGGSTPSRSTVPTAEHKNNGVYALSGSEISYNGIDMTPFGIYHDGNTIMLGGSSDLRYTYTGANGSIIEDLSYRPLNSDSVFNGVYSETILSNQTHQSGDAVFTVSGSGQTMTIDGPSTLDGAVLTWDGSEYQYEYSSGSTYSAAFISTDEQDAFALYANPNVVGAAFGTR